jgi:hypothetical protein
VADACNPRLEAEIGRTAVGGQPRQKISKTPSQHTGHVLWLAPETPDIQEAEIKSSWFKASLGKVSKTPFQQTN